MPRNNTNNNSSNSTNKSSRSMDSMKYEIADEYGVELGADATARENGRVGGEMTKRLVNKGKQSQ